MRQENRTEKYEPRKQDKLIGQENGTACWVNKTGHQNRTEVWARETERNE